MLIFVIHADEDRMFVEQLYIEHGGELLQIAKGILGNEEDAEDAVQTAFTLIIKYLKRIQNLGNTEKISFICQKQLAYCIVIVKNVSRKLYVKQDKRTLSAIEEVAYTLADTDPTPEQLVMHSEEVTQLKDRIQQLPQSLSRPLMMRYFDDMRIKDIALHLGISENLVSKRIQRALQALAKQFA